MTAIYLAHTTLPPLERETLKDGHHFLQVGRKVGFAKEFWAKEVV